MATGEGIRGPRKTRRSMSTADIAIALAALGGLCEIAGILTVVREIASDRDRAKRMLSKPRNYTPPERHYPAKLGSHSFGAGGYGGQGVVASTMRPGTDHQITRLAAELGNGLLAVREMTDEEFDRLEGTLLEEIDTGYNELRADLRDVLESDMKLRLWGVGLLLLGVALSTDGSVLGNVG
jgi:hypothetical protein